MLQPWSSHLNLPFLLFKYEVQHITSVQLNPWAPVLGNHQSTSENSWIAYVLLCCPYSCHILQDACEDLSLQTWDFFQLSEEGITYYFILIKQSTQNKNVKQTSKTMSFHYSQPALSWSIIHSKAKFHTSLLLSHPKGNSPSLPSWSVLKEPVLIYCSTPAMWDIPPHLFKPKETYAFKKRK